MNSEIRIRPDFVIIGAMKSATSSLQEQLERQPGIFMTEPKEPNFFSNDEVFARGEAWYSSLFSDAEKSDLKGEASTHYTKLPRYPNTINRLKEYAPSTKLIYVMRHPVDRLVSHYVHNWSMGFVERDVGIEEALANYENFVSYSLYSMQLQPWFEAFGRDNVLPVFFDRLLEHQQFELERICSFIGFGAKPEWLIDTDASNVSSQRIRKFPLYSLLVESSLASWARKKLIPQSFRDRVKSRLRLNERPELTAETRDSLESVFDQDLKCLGDWLGIGLNCKNFSEITASQSLDWAER